MRRTIEKGQGDQTKQTGRIFSEMPWIRKAKDLEASIGGSLDGGETATILEDGRRVYRWPSDPGVKVAFVTLRSGRRPTGIVVALSDLEIELGIRLDDLR